jgi:hypothetical protein
MITIGRNKPILATVCISKLFILGKFTFVFFLLKNLEIKSLIIEAYHMGPQELLYIIPFVAKILESCAKSKVKS